MSLSQIESQLEQLEVKVAYQEITIEQLNSIITEQQNSIDKLQEQMKFLSQKIKHFEPSMVIDINDETPPPHY